MPTQFAQHGSTTGEDAIEAEAFRDWHRLCPYDVRQALEFECLSLDRGCAISLPGAPGAIFNRMFALPEPDELEEAYRWMSAKPGTKYLQIGLSSASDRARHWVAAKELVEQGAPWAKLVYARAAGITPLPRAPACRIVHPDEAQLFGSIICKGFGLPETLIPIWASIVGQESWSCFFALDGDEPIGTGAMYCSGDRGWLGAGTVLPAFRSRGAHKALIHARVAEGQARGVSRFAVEAKFSATVTANTSYANLVKMGFKHAYSRQNFAL